MTLKINRDLIRLYNAYLAELGQRQPQEAAILTLAHIIAELAERDPIMIGTLPDLKASLEKSLECLNKHSND